MSITLCPSLLSADFLNLENELMAFKDEKDLWFHLDVMDGHFVPNMTFGPPIIKAMNQISPHPLDVHLMVDNPDFHIEKLIELKPINITFHVEAVDDPVKLLKKIRSYKIMASLSLRPSTDLSVLTPDILSHIDLLLVMSVEPGFGGQSFMESTYKRLDEIHKLKEDHQLKFALQIDGGVSDQNAWKLIDHGATHLVAGSFIFSKGPEFYAKRLASLRTRSH